MGLWVYGFKGFFDKLLFDHHTAYNAIIPALSVTNFSFGMFWPCVFSVIFFVGIDDV